MSYSQLWDSVTAPAVPVDWNADAPLATSNVGAGAISSPNVLALDPAATSATRFFATLATPDGNGGDFTASGYFQFGGTAQCRWGLTARGSSATLDNTSTSCYLFELISNIAPVPAGGSALNIRISTLIAGSETQVAQLRTTTTGGGGFTVGAWYLMTAVLSGTSLAIQLQRVSDGFLMQVTGAWSATGIVNCLSTTDATLSGAGYCGVEAIQSASSQGLITDSYSLSSVAAPGAPVLPFPQPAYPLEEPAPSIRSWPGLPSAGTPTPGGPGLLAFPPQSWRLLEELGFWATPPAIPWQVPGIPAETRPGIPTRVPQAGVPADEPTARIFASERLPSPGSPPPILIGPPGPARSIVASIEEVPGRADPPAGLPSAGTPTLEFLPPPGQVLVLMAFAEESPPHANVPAGLPSAGTPTSTGDGLLVPPDRIAHSWLAGGMLGGGGILGFSRQYGNLSFSSPGVAGSWGDLTTGGDAGPGLAGWSGFQGLEALPSPSGPSPGGGSQPFSLGMVGCCCNTNTTVCLAACGALHLPIYGATINLISGGVIVDSCITGTTGCCSFAETGTYTVQVVISGVVEYQATRVLDGTTIAISLGTNSGIVCCGGYAIPWVLTVTDSEGSTAFVYDPNFVFPLWTGGHSVQRQSCSVTTPNNICIVAPPSQGPVRVCYQMICHAGQNPTFAVQRSWSWVFQQGTLTPIWYQDTSGFAPGQFCITAPPAICGNPLTDTASFGANPSSAVPFMLGGTPAAATSNATADPIGGPVAISA